MKRIESHTVPELEEGAQIRLSDYLPGILSSITSKKGIKKAIENRLVKINDEIGHTSNYVKNGDIIEIFKAKPPRVPRIKFEIEVAYEDDYLAIINKPAGVVVSGNKKWTVENMLAYNLKKAKKPDALHKMDPVHRLDYPTSGALLIAKTEESVKKLNKLFEERKVSKTYYAVTIGEMKAKGQKRTAIKGKPAKTDYKVLQKMESDKYGFLNLVELNPETGRRHQLRIHLSELGNPILGDKKYGKKGLISHGNGLYLHATNLSFVHPFTEMDLSVNVDLPKKFGKLFGEIAEVQSDRVLEEE